MLKPIGDRVLIKPDERPKQTDTGLHLVEDWKPENSGTVVAVGRKPNVVEVTEMLRLIDDMKFTATVGPGIYSSPPETLHELFDVYEFVGNLGFTTREVPFDVAVGDVVVFGWNVGQEIFVDDERYLLMRESDISAVLETEDAGVA